MLVMSQEYLASCTAKDGDIKFLPAHLVSLKREKIRFLSKDLEVMEKLSSGDEETVNSFISLAKEAT